MNVFAAGLALLALPLAAAAGPTAEKVKAGEAVYARCMGCHALAYDRTGPRHCGLFGRRAGSVAGFPYSDAMKASDIVWTARTLNRFLKNPTAAVPGTSMGYSGVPDPAERAALIVFLQNVDGRPECRGKNGQQ
ncbi:c-type cytochrome [Massilia cavernae]|uniref:Cytochrome c family protein n=1 Tax=Massilia cavernae TaxID=2320864 RepID=A0A418XR36_9BURK|nr:c-type cytochrome [Massilia cavernae]RJG14994.1 cytochrome c family protein [Massilia cavernae]